MFTGIIREVGRVHEIEKRGDTRFRIVCARPVETIEIGASICCNGVCLTAIATGRGPAGGWFDVEASAETLDKTTLGDWAVGTAVNLEPSLRLGDELGGHIVSGHVDGVGEIRSIAPVGDSHRVEIAAPAALGRFIAQKGSITVDGISLTVNAVTDDAGETLFALNIIPHTWQVTNLADTAAGRRVNLEIDLLARYVARLAEASG